MNRRGSALVAIALGCAPLAGCIVEEHHYDPGSSYGPSYPVMSIPICPSGAGAAAAVTIDTGQSLTTNVGEGTGVFVEYQAGGHWHIWTSCDTILTGAGCAYDVTARVLEGTVSNVRGEDLESQDFAGSQCADTAYLSVNTGSNLDGMLFDAPAGNTVRVTAALGGAIYPDILYWVGGNVARNDANSNPVDFTPSAP
jgi:hypothetical protein